MQESFAGLTQPSLVVPRPKKLVVICEENLYIGYLTFARAIFGKNISFEFFRKALKRTQETLDKQTVLEFQFGHY